MQYLIETEEKFNKLLPQLVTNYRAMFAEKPFNNPNISNQYAIDFFTNTFKHGLIFIDTTSSDKEVYGFRTMIESKYFKDFDKFDMLEKSLYLSAIWIKPNIRGRSLGNDLMDFSIKKAIEIYQPETFYVRTRTDTPHIQNLLKKKSFKILKKYDVEINNEVVGLVVWEYPKFIY